MEADSREQSLEQLACLPRKRRSALVFLEPRRLADEHQVGVGIARAEDDAIARLGQRAPHTAGGFGCVGVKRGNAGEGIHQTASLGAAACARERDEQAVQSRDRCRHSVARRRAAPLHDCGRATSIAPSGRC